MRKLGIALALALSVGASGCVQTRQFADVQFTPPQGDYRLLVMRPDVIVNSLTTGGMAEPRADWSEQARNNILNALRAQQGERGGKLLVMAKRTELPGISAEQVADLERLHWAVGNSRSDVHSHTCIVAPASKACAARWRAGIHRRRRAARGILLRCSAL